MGRQGPAMLDGLDTLVSPETIALAARALLDHAPTGSMVILFGSYARGDATAGSDLDFLVVEPDVTDEATESVRLRRAVGSIGVGVDVLVADYRIYERWRQIPSNVVYFAAAEGKRFE